MKIRPILVSLSASTALLAASGPALAGHDENAPTGRNYCTQTAENPNWAARIGVSESVVPGHPRPGQTLHFRINAYQNVNHFEADPRVIFTDAATGEETVTHLPGKLTEPSERQRLVWSFTVPREGTVSIRYDAVWYCAGNSTEHADGLGGTGSFEVRENHPDLFL